MAEPRLSTVGTGKTADHDVAHVPVKPLKDIIVDVDWQVETPPDWKSTTESEANKTFITDYKLSEVKGEMPVEFPDTWKSTTDLEKKTTFITDHKLSKVKDEDYKYKLEFVSSQTREYDFIDANDLLHRVHSNGGETTKISYNSDKPGIKVIKL